MNSHGSNKIRIAGNITTPYGGKTRGEPVHLGVDIANKSGTPIPALTDGQVISAGPLNNGLGNSIAIKDAGGNIQKYSHLRKILVRPGEVVNQNKEIGTMGDSGNSYSPSGGDASHLDIRISDPDGRTKNPMAYLKK